MQPAVTKRLPTPVVQDSYFHKYEMKGNLKLSATTPDFKATSGDVKHTKDYFCKMAVNMWRKPLKQSLFILLIELYFVVGKRNVVQLNEDNWKEMLDQEWMVEL
jgi:hypothetical protein